MGRESLGEKIEGMEKRGGVDFFERRVCCCFLMLSPKRVKVGSVDGAGEAMDAADRHVVVVVVGDAVLCCWLAV